MSRIVVVEDDQIISQVITEFLKENGYEVFPIFDGQKALECFKESQFDLLILDIMLPSLSGLEVLKEVRKTSDVPIMMLTAMDDEYTQLLSFNNLISDYVVKPFSPLVLMKRIENILRKSKDEIANEIRIGELTLLLDFCEVYFSGKKVSLTRKEYSVLEVLAKRKGHLVTREQLMNQIWGYPELDSRVLDNHIKNLRKKLPNLAIITITGMGYKLEVE